MAMPARRPIARCSRSSKRLDGKVDEAVEALKTLVAKYRDDRKNWPIYIKQIKAYCAKM